MRGGVSSCVETTSIASSFTQNDNPQCIIIVQCESNLMLTDEVAPHRVYTAHDTVGAVEQAFLGTVSVECHDL